MYRTTTLLFITTLLCTAPGFGAEPPAKLSETGFGAPGVLEFRPQYALWSDGARKRRWILLPTGATIDATNLDFWRFPVGTKLWKEFSFPSGADPQVFVPVETRMMVKEADGWKFYAYHWRNAGDAELVEEGGRTGVHPLGNGKSHDIPARESCLECHNWVSRDPVLGFTALQLSDDPDPLALGRSEGVPPLTNRMLKEKGLLPSFPDALTVVDQAPRIHAATDRDRRAIGYLHANCGHCHTPGGILPKPAFRHPIAVTGAADEPALKVVGQKSGFDLPGETTSLTIRAGDPDRSVAYVRLSSREEGVQMPPLGTKLVDKEAVEAIGEWIRAMAADSSPR